MRTAVSMDFMRRISRMGCEARMRKLSPERRSALARNAARARWLKREAPTAKTDRSIEQSNFKSELSGTSQRFPPCEGAFGFSEVTTMDWNRIQGNWKQAQGKIKEKWGKLTDDDLVTINGQREQLEGIIEKRYGDG
jgi:uncharacterized protein YjbJ (UPF0337 family)